MGNWLAPLLIAAGIALAPAPVPAQAAGTGEPDNLNVLPRPQQVRIIAREYEARSGGRAIPDDLLDFYLERVQRSTWTRGQVGQDITRALAEAGSTPAASDTVVCESTAEPVACAVPWQTGARVVRQLSDTPCVEGQNFAASPGRVIVQSGCAAEFAATTEVGHGRDVVCESRDSSRTTCPTGGGVARLARQLSAAGCVEGHSWGSAADSVWVDYDCRAVFHVTGVSGAVAP